MMETIDNGRVRHVILHYHLFKNAGTSLDRIFQRNFPNKWVTREFDERGRNNSDKVSEWIASEPDAIIFSSHTAIGPIPEVADAKVFPVIFLRDPIARIRSAYRFERAQDADTFGSRIAKQYNFEGYVRKRLSNPGDRQCKNFQTMRLAAFVPGGAPELDRAVAALQWLPFVGVVEKFEESLTKLDHVAPIPIGATELKDTRVNASTSVSTEELTVSDGLQSLLQHMNSMDRLLHDFAYDQMVSSR